MGRELIQDESWKNVEEVILFGYGKQGKKVLSTLQKDFKIIAIVDNDAKKTGGTIDTIPVLYFDDAVELLKKYKIIVTVAEYYYKEIVKQLKKINLIENKDFIMYKPFILEWYYKYKKKVYLLKVDVIVTSLCSLKCENCSLFIPYWKKKENFNIENLKDDADQLFRCVDFVLDIDIIGGEPFLYKDLNTLLLWYGKHYRHKIGHLGIITNGTVIPNRTTLDIIKEYNIIVSISDYSETVGYKERVDELCELLTRNQIKYIRNTDIQWFDFGFPRQKYCYEGEAVKKHMECCNTICNCLNEGHIYYCTTAWAAYKGGIYPEAFKNGIGYVNLNEVNENSLADKKNILDCCSGNIKGEFINFCKVCGGYGNDNGNKIKTAIQL